MTTDNYTFPANLTIQIVSNGKELWYNSPLISSLLGVIVGAVLMVLANILNSRLKERTELERYEYTLLSITKDLLNRPPNDETQKEINDFVDKIYPDLRFSKIKSSKLIIDALIKAMNGDDKSEKMTKIDNRIKEIKKVVKTRIL
jgi:capsular polysaccharide biosynthesis protein